MTRQKLISRCTECGAPSHNHCKAGKWGGCCRTWTGYAAFDKHRVGNHGDGTRRCMTDEEMSEAGARLTPRGWTFAEPMDPGTRDRVRGAVGELDEPAES